MKTDEETKKAIMALKELCDAYKDHEALTAAFNEFDYEDLTNAEGKKFFIRVGTDIIAENSKEFHEIEAKRLYKALLDDKEAGEYIEALSMAIIRLSVILKTSRYSIVDAIRINFEANY